MKTIFYKSHTSFEASNGSVYPPYYVFVSMVYKLPHSLYIYMYDAVVYIVHVPLIVDRIRLWTNGTPFYCMWRWHHHHWARQRLTLGFPVFFFFFIVFSVYRLPPFVALDREFVAGSVWFLFIQMDYTELHWNEKIIWAVCQFTDNRIIKELMVTLVATN